MYVEIRFHTVEFSLGVFIYCFTDRSDSGADVIRKVRFGIEMVRFHFDASPRLRYESYAKSEVSKFIMSGQA